MGQDEPSPALIQPHELGIGRLFEHIRDAVVVADVDTGQIVLWNPAATVLLGYSHAEALELPLETLIPERYRASHRAGIAHYRATGHGLLIDSGSPVTVMAQHQAGHEISVELTLSPIQDVRRRGRFVLAILRDVTERAERARLEGVVLATRTLEHELGNQLTKTVGYLNLILADPELPPAFRQKILSALRGANAAAGTIQRLRELTTLPRKHWGPGVDPTIDVGPPEE
jgi:PAS domain S-box-containing protein